jgi:thiamine pyrophosphate-dependent acetolactate synthase large subunit-like protein
MTARDGAHVLVEALLAQGVDTLFGIPGVATLRLYDAFLDHREVRPINVRHEQAAVFMADGFARASGSIGVALTSGGPGALNTLTAMGTAYNDSSAVLHITNENPPAVRKRGRGYFHDISDQLAVFRPVSDLQEQVLLAEEIPAALHRSMFALRNRRPRPAMLEVAAEAFDQVTEVEIGPKAARIDRRADDDAIARAAAAVVAAQRPVIWAGGGVVMSGADQELRRLAERLGAPVLTSQAGKGSLPADHELHLGNWANEEPVRRLLRDSDLLIAVGTRFSYFPTGGWSMPQPASLVHIDLDPTQIGRDYQVAVPVVGDATQALVQLLEELDAFGYEGLPSRAAEVADIRRQIDAAVGPSVELDVLDQIRSALPRSTRVFNDPTTLAFWARSYWPAYEPRTWFVPSGFGTLGFALPAAIGAKVAVPDDPCVAIIGDAGVMFTIQDLMTAVQERVSVVVLVFNDGGYGVERRHQDHLFGRQSNVDMLAPDFVRLAQSFGARGMRVDDLSGVGTALEAALEAEGPVLIEVPNQFRHPGYGAMGAYD